MTDPYQDKTIVAFDGECLLCSRSIRFLAERDRRDRIRFTRLQEPLGREMAASLGGSTPDSALVLENGNIHVRSDAVLAALKALGGGWKILFYLGKVIPRPLRDRLYDFIARRRYRWFGKGDACALPSEALRRRLLPQTSSMQSP